MTDIKEKTISSWLHGNHDRSLFSAVSGRTRGITEVDKLKRRINEKGNYDCSRQDVVRFFQFLQELGWGRFVVGRRGKESRFEWNEGIRSDWPSPSDFDTSNSTDETTGRSAQRRGHRTPREHYTESSGENPRINLVYRVNVRPGVAIEIHDLTAEEASALADAFRDLEKKLK